MKQSDDKSFNSGNKKADLEHTDPVGATPKPIVGGTEHQFEKARDLNDPLSDVAESGAGTDAAGSTLGGAAGIAKGATNINQGHKKL